VEKTPFDEQVKAEIPFRRIRVTGAIHKPWNHQSMIHLSCFIIHI